MTSKLAIILLMCAAAWGQQTDTTSCIRGKTCPGLVIGQPDGYPGYVEIDDAVIYTTLPSGRIIPMPNAESCPKYQHWESGRMGCDMYVGMPNACDKWIPAKCVDDIHTVTEREWAELMARLKALESRK
jgi:hypothetical protein